VKPAAARSTPSASIDRSSFASAPTLKPGDALQQLRVFDPQASGLPSSRGYRLRHCGQDDPNWRRRSNAQRYSSEPCRPSCRECVASPGDGGALSGNSPGLGSVTGPRHRSKTNRTELTGSAHAHTAAAVGGQPLHDQCLSAKSLAEADDKREHRGQHSPNRVTSGPPGASGHGTLHTKE
jgi:hypothetical protein